MKILKYILFILFALLGLFNEIEAKIILLENQETKTFSEKNFDEQTQEIKWLGLLHLQEESSDQNQISSFNFSTRSFNQNLSEELCLKSTSDSLDLIFNLVKS